jgi:nitrite reductase/ring-hydroxylating ferredoxin subunit
MAFATDSIQSETDRTKAGRLLAVALRFTVCPAKDIAEGTLKSFSLPGLDKPVLISKSGNRFYASSAICAHEEVSLAKGKIEGNWVVCPGHGWRFDLASGVCEHNADVSIPTYTVHVVDGNIVIEII